MASPQFWNPFDVRSSWAARLLAIGFLAATQSGTVIAGPYEDAIDAIGRRDYATAVELLSPLARKGDASAQAQLGSLYACGCGVEKDERQAFDLFQKSADQGSALGQARLGTAYENGDGVARNPRKAIELYRRAARAGSVEGQANLCAIYLGSSGKASDFVEAAKWCQLAARAGDARSQYHLGLCYERGQGVPVNPQEAFAWLKKSAESGLPPAQYKLANLLMLSEGPLWDGSQGMLWAAVAAAAGVPDAGVLLGLGHYYGVGVPKNPRRALYWAQEEVRSGNPAGLMLMGQLAAAGLSGTDIPPLEMAYVAYSLASRLMPDEDRRLIARKFLSEIKGAMSKEQIRDAERRLADASHGGLSDFSGKRPNQCAIEDILIETDDRDVRDDCGRLAALGIPVGNYNLGWMALHGEKVPADPQRGLLLLERAAADDFPAAQLELGKQYSSGEFVKRDRRRSLGWLLVAKDRLATANLTSNYLEDAVKSADDVRKELTTVEAHWASRWARDWFASHTWSDRPFEQCNFVQLDESRMKTLFDTVYEAAAGNTTPNVYTNARTIGGTCAFDYQPDYGTSAHLSFTLVVKPPESGSLERFRDVGFQYRPDADYRGIDRFVIRICGSQTEKAQICFDTNVAVEIRCAGPDDCGGSSEPEKPEKRF